jgi:hypothetical protein
LNANRLPCAHHHILVNRNHILSRPFFAALLLSSIAYPSPSPSPIFHRSLHRQVLYRFDEEVSKIEAIQSLFAMNPDRVKVTCFCNIYNTPEELGKDEAITMAIAICKRQTKPVYNLVRLFHAGCWFKDALARVSHLLGLSEQADYSNSIDTVMDEILQRMSTFQVRTVAADALVAAYTL